MSSNLTTLDSLTKNVYLPGLPKWVNERRPLYKRLSKITKKEAFTGRALIFAAQENLPQGGGAIGESEVLPVAGQSGIVNMTLAMKYHYFVARLSAQIIESASTDKGSFASAVKTELNGIRSQLEEDLAICGLFGDGSGAVAEVAGYAATTLTLKAQPVVGQNGSRNLKKGRSIATQSSKSGAWNASQAHTPIVTVLTPATVQTAAGLGFQVGDFVFPSVTATVDPRNKCVQGLRAVIDDGTNTNVFQGLDRDDYPSLQSMVLGAAGVLRAWSPELMDQGAMEGALNGGGKNPSAIYSPLEIQRRAASYLRADRTYDMKLKTLDGGYKGVEWTTPEGTIPWFWDRYCIPNRVEFVCEEDLFLAIQMDVEFANNDGKMWRYTDRRDEVEAWLRTWRNLGARACNNHTSLRDISHTA